jgi:hypothetical protein
MIFRTNGSLRGTVNSLLALLIFGAISTGCGKKDDDANGGLACMPDGQAKSYHAPVPDAPLQVVLDSGFSQTEVSQIQAAIREWNGVGGFFSIRTAAIPAAVRAANPHDCSQSLGTQKTFFIVKETSDDHWRSMGFSRSVPGATLRCEVNKQEFVQQIVMINPSLIDPSQFQSVILHELGHTLGVEHSCDGADGDIRCSSIGANTNHPYHKAVMYPSISRSGPNGPETKTSLTSNDSARARCLYNM